MYITKAFEMSHLLGEWGLPDKRRTLVRKKAQCLPKGYLKKCYGFVQLYAPDVYASLTTKKRTKLGQSFFAINLCSKN